MGHSECAVRCPVVGVLMETIDTMSPINQMSDPNNASTRIRRQFHGIGTV